MASRRSRPPLAGAGDPAPPWRPESQTRVRTPWLTGSYTAIHSPNRPLIRREADADMQSTMSARMPTTSTDIETDWRCRCHVEVSPGASARRWQPTTPESARHRGRRATYTRVAMHSQATCNTQISAGRAADAHGILASAFAHASDGRACVFEERAYSTHQHVARHGDPCFPVAPPVAARDVHAATSHLKPRYDNALQRRRFWAGLLARSQCACSKISCRPQAGDAVLLGIVLDNCRSH
jgi:hypothetical protein